MTDHTILTRRTALGLAGATATAALVGVGAESALADPSWPFTMGLNVSGLADGGVIPGVPNVNYGIPTAEHLDYYLLRGFTQLRLPFKWERLQPALNGALDPAYLGYITDLVDHAETNGQELLLDLHNYGWYAGGKLGSSAVPVSAFADVWSRLADVFAGRAGVYGYDLMNEPHDLPSATVWPTAAQAAVDAIRTIDTATTIFVEGDGWSSAFAWPDVNADLDIDDPSDNLVYSAHTYLDRNSSGIYYDWDEEVAAGDLLYSPPRPLTVDIGMQRIARFAGWLADKGFRGHIGEIGVAKEDPAWLEALDRALAYCQTQDIPVSYWGAGPFFREYPLGVEPTDGVDTVQMAVLTKYTGGARPSSYLLSGPGRGTPGAPSDEVRVEYRGLVTSPFTITPDDDGAGGTFTPSSQIIDPGFNGVASFTYTQAGAGTFALSTTNDGGLDDPPAIGYSTRADAFSTIPDDALLNVLSTERLYTPFVGAAVLLRRVDDGAELEFDFTGSDTLDMAAIQAWAGTSDVAVARWADQSPGQHDAGPVTTSNKQGAGNTHLPSSPQDYPLLVSGGPGGTPALRFSDSRMDAVSPVAGAEGFTCFLVAKPTTVGGMQRLMSWVVTDFLTIGNGTGGWDMSAESPQAQSLGVDTSAWHIYAVRWEAGGRRTSWVDGAQVADSAATAPEIPMAYEHRVNIGYFRWYPDVYFDGDVYGLFPFSAALTPAQMSELWSELSGRTGIALA